MHMISTLARNPWALARGWMAPGT